MMAQAAAALCFGLATDPMLLFCAYMVLQFCARSVSVWKLGRRSTKDAKTHPRATTRPFPSDERPSVILLGLLDLISRTRVEPSLASRWYSRRLRSLASLALARDQSFSHARAGR